MFDFKTLGLFTASPLISQSGNQYVPETITGFSENLSDIIDDGFMKSYHEPEEPLDDFMKKFTKNWSNQEETTESLGLVGIKDDYALPKWLDGEFLVSGPSKFYMGNMKVNTALDGFGRYSRFNIKDGDITFNSKLMNSTWFNECEKANKIIPGMTFMHTTPERWESKIPFVNLYYSSTYYDNDWVQPNRLPDGKTYVGMTDMSDMIVIDLETLTSKGLQTWEDDLPCKTGGTHVEYNKAGEMFGICGDIEPTGTNHLILYKILPENIHKRIVVATISTGKIPVYEHSFGFNEEYATIFQHPVSFDMTKQILGYPLIDCMTYDDKTNTILHVVKLEDGSIETIDSGFPFQMMHTGNQFIKDNKLIVDATTYTCSQEKIFGSLTFDKMKKQSDLLNQGGGSWTRFEIDLNDKTVNHFDLTPTDFGGYELPAFNHLMRGEETCYTYTTAFFRQQTIDEDYGWDFAKIDACNQNITSQWHQSGYLPNEPHFVPNPEGKSEDDGVLLTVAYDFRNEMSKLLVIDTIDMKTLQEFELPHIIPQYFHSNYWASE